MSLPAPLVTLFPGCPREACLRAATVREAIDALDHRWPGLRGRLCDEAAGLRRHIRVYVQGEIAGLETRLASGDEVFVMTAISGG